jgi:hypothetical protein
MAVEMSKVYCVTEDCKFRTGCIVCNSVDNGARFCPVLKLKLESLVWKLRCFSYVRGRRDEKRIFTV